MTTTEIKQKPKVDTPKEEQPVETVKDNNDASTNAETKNRINKEAKVVDEEIKKQDLLENLESDQGKTDGAEKNEAPESSEETTDDTDETTGQENSDDLDETEITENDLAGTDDTENISLEKQVALPEGVTTEPRNEEEMDITTIKHSETLLDVYLNVSDDNGQMHGNLELEKEIMQFNLRHSALKVATIVDANKVLQESTELINRYTPVLGKSAHVAAGVMTKYGIRLGMIFNIQKLALRKLKIKWSTWFKDKHKSMSLRSAQDWMALARIPGIIKYAFLGKERLLELSRIINDYTVKDPFKNYIKNHGVKLNPKKIDYDKTKDVKKEIDGVIAIGSIEKAEATKDVQLGVDKEIVKTLVNMGIKFDNSLISRLFLLKEYNKDFDVNTYLVDVLQKGGAEDAIIDRDKKIRNVPKLVGLLNSTIKFMKEQTDFKTVIEISTIDDLEDSVSRLKDLIEAS
jgi:hypothetical protein